MTGVRGTVSRPQVALAIIPLGVAFLASLLTWGWRVLDWPLAVYLSPVYLGASAVLVLGALFGVVRGMPRWSYAWGALALGSLGVIGEVVVFVLFQQGGLIQERDRSVYHWALQGTNLLWVFLALGGSLYLARRSALDGFLFFTLFLGNRLVAFPILLESGVLGAWTPGLTGALALIAVAEGVAAAWLLIYFLRGRNPLWKPFYGLVLLVFLNAPLKDWLLLVQQVAWSDRLRFFGESVARYWFFDAGFLLAVWVAIRLSRVSLPRGINFPQPPPSA